MFKSLSKHLLRLAVILAVLIFALNLTLDLVLFFTKNKIVRGINQNEYFHASVGQIFYIFPNKLVLKDLVLKKAPSSEIENPQELGVSTVVFKFSVGKLLTQRNLHLTKVEIFRPLWQRDELNSFLKENMGQIIALIKQLPVSDLIVRLDRGQIFLQRPQSVDIINTDLFFKLHKRAFFGYGSFNRDNLRYYFEGRLTSDSVKIEKLILGSPALYAQLWGKFNDKILKVDGYTFMKTRGLGGAASKKGLLRRVSNVMRRMNPRSIRKLKEPDLFFLDIDGLVKFRFPNVVVDHLNFTANDLPVTMKGGLNLGDKTVFNFTSQIAAGTSAQAKKREFRKMDFGLSGYLKDKILKGDGYLQIFFEGGKTRSHTPNRFETTLQNLRLSIKDYQQLKLFLGEWVFSFWANDNEHKVVLKNFETSANLQPNQWNYAAFKADYAGGGMSGRIWVDTTRRPLSVTSQMSLKKVEANQMKDLLVHFAKVYGEVDSEITLKKDPKGKVRGVMTINDGVLKDFQFFEWMADTFASESLRHVNFERVTTEFIVTPEMAGLEDIVLEAQDVKLKGHYIVDKESLVSSKISMTLSRPLMMESKKLRRVMALFEQDVPSLVFDFQLSGLEERMNFQWLQSDFKRRIQKRIPDFIERKIERAIDVMLESEEPEEGTKEEEPVK